MDREGLSDAGGGGGISLLDRLMVLDRIASYSWAIDSGRLDDYLNCFGERTVLRHPLPDGPPGTWTGHAGIRSFVERGFTNRPTQTYAHQHQISAVRLLPEGADIRVDAYAAVLRYDFHRQYWPRGASWRMGTWHALFVRAGETWKLLDLDVRMWTDSAFENGVALLNRPSGMPGPRD